MSEILHPYTVGYINYDRGCDEWNWIHVRAREPYHAILLAIIDDHCGFEYANYSLTEAEAMEILHGDGGYGWKIFPGHVPLDVSVSWGELRKRSPRSAAADAKKKLEEAQKVSVNLANFVEPLISLGVAVPAGLQAAHTECENLIAGLQAEYERYMAQVAELARTCDAAQAKRKAINEEEEHLKQTAAAAMIDPLTARRKLDRQG